MIETVIGKDAPPSTIPTAALKCRCRGYARDRRFAGISLLPSVPAGTWLA